MTRLFTILLSIGLYSCSSTGNQDNGTTATESDSSHATTSQTDSMTIPFAGFWVTEKYVNDIKKNKSPRQSQPSEESCITIPDKTMQVTRMVWGFHDGGADLTVIKKDDRYQFNYFYDDTLRDFAQSIEVISNDKIKIGKKYFIKTNTKFLEELLFSGQYRLDNGSTVEFSDDGQITGLDNYKTYNPFCDYTGPGLDIDQIILGQTDKDEKRFGFKFSTDTLLIYNIKCVQYDSLNKMCAVVDYGQLAYRLTRKN